MTTRTFFKLSLLLAIALPAAALTSCKDDTAASAKHAAEAKYHYAVAMTGVV